KWLVLNPIRLAGFTRSLTTANTTKLSDGLEAQIKDALAPLCPEAVILFGSQAWGLPTEDSDIDLYVVTWGDFLPATWQQKRDVVRAVSNRILDLRTRYAIDLLVHTKPMHRRFLETDSSFARQIMEEGVRLL
ncbi:MAG TPA: nucleotidyltransferase domain-containing protein, partial [Sedimentisphaerales bacterium]|nr:nucleotidyltransferase domain-containing protein [Sedimentisphaerales bacterium]